MIQCAIFRFRGKSMKIVYIANARIPTEKAHGLQMSTMCEQFGLLGNEVLMLAPTRNNNIKSDVFDFYHIKKSFNIKYITCPDFIKYGQIGFILTSWIFAFLTTQYIFKQKFDLVYSRDGRSLWLLSWFRNNFVWEIHDDQRKWWAKRVLKKGICMVTTNKALVGLHENFEKANLKSLVAPNGMTIYEHNEDKTEVRKKIGIENYKKIILYTGHLYKYKGADVLAEAAKKMPQFDFLFVGGTNSDVNIYKNRYKDIGNIHFIGYVEHNLVPQYLMSADLLVIPNSANDEFSKFYTSPIKLFEYIASGTPVIASDLPSIREVVDENEVYFFKPDNSEDLIKKINEAMQNPEDSIIKSINSFKKAKEYTWENRAKKILNFLNKK